MLLETSRFRKGEEAREIISLEITKGQKVASKKVCKKVPSQKVSSPEKEVARI
jgi:hypothetical protein